MKKILNIILTFIIVFGLSGCTENEPLETRLDELYLQLEELQTEIDAKDELLDSIILSIDNLNDTVYDSPLDLVPPILPEPLEDLQSELFSTIFEDEDYSILKRIDIDNSKEYYMPVFTVGNGDSKCILGYKERDNYIVFYNNEYYDIFDADKLNLYTCEVLKELGVVGLIHYNEEQLNAVYLMKATTLEAFNNIDFSNFTITSVEKLEYLYYGEYESELMNNIDNGFASNIIEISNQFLEYDFTYGSQEIIAGEQPELIIRLEYGDESIIVIFNSGDYHNDVYRSVMFIYDNSEWTYRMLFRSAFPTEIQNIYNLANEPK